MAGMTTDESWRQGSICIGCRLANRWRRGSWYWCDSIELGSTGICVALKRAASRFFLAISDALFEQFKGK